MKKKALLTLALAILCSLVISAQPKRDPPRPRQLAMVATTLPYVSIDSGRVEQSPQNTVVAVDQLTGETFLLTRKSGKKSNGDPYVDYNWIQVGSFPSAGKQ